MVFLSALFELLMLPAFALLADRVGLKPVAFFGALWTAAFSFPFFQFVDAGTPFSIGLGISLAMVGISALYAVLPAYVSRLFDTQVRFTGISLSYGIAAGVIGGLTPLLASSLFLWAKSPWPIALYLVGVGVISMIAVIVSPSFGSEASLQETPLAGGALSPQAPGN
jgi:MFS transporter, MHS family, shikimate and dehydroshikimate transport protein